MENLTTFKAVLRNEEIPGGFEIIEGPFVEFSERLAARGHRCSGVNRNPRQRAELQGQPTFERLTGPVYDGCRTGAHVIRYDDLDSNYYFSK